MNSNVHFGSFVEHRVAEELVGDLFEEEDSLYPIHSRYLEHVLFLLYVQQLNLNDGNLLHLLKPLSLENAILLVIHVVKKLFFVKALDLNYLGWLLDLEHFSDHGWNSVLLEVI